MTTATVQLELLVRDHSPGVYQHAYRLTKHVADAEDLTQDVFLRAMSSRTRCAPGSANGWLYRITVNLFRDQLRKSQRRPVLMLQPAPVDQAMGTTRGPRLDTPEWIVTDPIFDDDVATALAALPPTQREAVLLCDVDGFTYDEISVALGVSRGTVGSRISRGRAQLRAALAHRAARPGAQASGSASTST